MKETIHIIGAGIGGLTTALTLKQHGLSVNIYEAAAEIKPVGAGILMANNAMQVFKKMGIHEKIEMAGNKISVMKITDQNLKGLSVVDFEAFEKKYGVHSVAIHRGELQKILAKELGFENIHLSKRLTKIERGDNFKLTFEDNSSIETRILIGADGLKSVVRNLLFENTLLRNANQICWRGVCEINMPEKYGNEINEAWGRGRRFGFVKIGNNKWYWYALANSKNNNLNEVNLAQLFEGFHKDILGLIGATKKEKIIATEIIDLKPMDNWQQKNLCLIGDAAHATTPNLGQGACQAIEDAYIIGKLLEAGNSIEDCFEKYQTLRKPKADKIVNRSRMLGKLAHQENNIVVWLRNSIMKMTPDSMNKKQMGEIFELEELFF